MSNTALATTNAQPSRMTLFGKVKAALQEVNIDLEAIVETYAFCHEQQKEDPEFRVPTYRAKIPNGGGRAFDIITGDEDLDTSVPTFKGVIANYHKCNALFDDGETGDDADMTKPPLCQSYDGYTGTEAATGEVITCADCDNNQWGSAAKGNGKACKNMRRLYVLVEGSSIPIVITLPPTSIKVWEEYRASLSVERRTPYDVVTEFSLGPVQKNAAGQPYGVIKLKAVGLLTTETRLTVKAISSGEPYDRSISGEDYNANGNGSGPVEETTDETA